MKILFKYLLKIFKWSFIVIILYLLNAVLFSFLSNTILIGLNCSKDKEIFITTNGLHLEVIIPEKSVSPSLKKDLQIKNGAKYISFGWGDKGFYLHTPTWKELKFSTAVNALFLKSDSGHSFDQLFPTK